jgi:hypothetical protein
MKRRMLIVTCVLTLLANCLMAFGQDQQVTKDKAMQDAKAKAVAGSKFDVTIAKPRGGMGIGGDTFTFIAAEGAFGGNVVKGAPYSAEAVSENIQVLQDGNRIVQKNSSAIHRDSEGRTRTEHTLRSIGPYASAGEPPVTSFIFDPVAGFHYTLEPNSKIARKMEMPRFEKGGDGDTFVFVTGSAGHGENVVLTEDIKGQGGNIKLRKPGAPPAVIHDKTLVISQVEASGGRVSVRSNKPENLKTEALGKQNIEGVEAEGTRSTFTIPAGEIGNEQPINIVTESWYSPELQVTVMRKHSDPRQGEMIYRLTNIRRVEPDASLFSVPADYTVKENLPSKMRLDMEREIVREKMKKPEKNDQ